MEAGRVGEGKKTFLRKEDGRTLRRLPLVGEALCAPPYQKILDSRGPLMEAVTIGSGIYGDFWVPSIFWPLQTFQIRDTLGKARSMQPARAFRPAAKP